MAAGRPAGKQASRKGRAAGKAEGGKRRAAGKGQAATKGQATRLKSYRAKRDFARTPEPAPSRAAAKGKPRFVIHQHDATRLHWDFRLEHDRVLASWAVPKGIPEAPKDNRLAVATEDHPLEYIDFKGEIPKGQYGAGTMDIWDHGTYDVLKWEPRKVEVELHGERLTGRYALFPLSNLPGWLSLVTHLNPMTYAVEPVRAVVFARLNIPDAARAVLDPGIWWGSYEVPVLLQVGIVAASALVLLFAAVKLFARTE